MAYDCCCPPREQGPRKQSHLLLLSHQGSCEAQMGLARSFCVQSFSQNFWRNGVCGELLLASDRGEEQRPLVCLALGCQTPELGRTQKCFFSALLVLHFPIDLRCLLRGHCLISLLPACCALSCSLLCLNSVPTGGTELCGDTEDGLVACSGKESRGLGSTLTLE